MSRIYFLISKWLEEILTFGNTEIKKTRFYLYESPIFVGDVDIKSLSVSNKISFHKNNYKYVIGYLHDYYKIKPLHKKLPKTKVYVKSCDGQTKWMYFLIENGDLIKKKQCYLG